MSSKSFDSLFAELAAKIAARDPQSQSVKAFDAGIHEAGKKLLEEAGEVWIAAEHEDSEALAEEISQLLYRIQILALIRGLDLDMIYRKL